MDKTTLAVHHISIDFAGLAAVYLIYKVSQELFDTKTAETAMLLSALAPFQIHYAQEIRMYAFLALWLLLATYSYLRGSRSGNWQWWLVFGVSSALAQYTHNLAAFFLVPLALMPIFKRDWKTFRSLLISGLFAVLLYLPWLIQLPSQFAKVDQAYWVTKPEISTLFTLLLVFITNLPLPTAWILPGLAVSILMEGTAAEALVRHHLDKLQSRKFKELGEALGLDGEDLQAEIVIVRGLDPRPGQKYNAVSNRYVVPDVYVVRIDDHYQVILNEEGYRGCASARSTEEWSSAVPPPTRPPRRRSTCGGSCGPPSGSSRAWKSASGRSTKWRARS